MSDIRDTMNNSERGADTGSETATVSRRHLLRGGATAVSGVVLGASAIGSVSANGRFNDAPGRGAAAVVTGPNHDGNREFELIGRAMDIVDEDEIPIPIDESGELFFVLRGFQCWGQGEDLQLVGWDFRYLDEDKRRRLYTRSNNLDTEKTYTFKSDGRGATYCDEGDADEPFYVTPFRATGPQ